MSKVILIAEDYDLLRHALSDKLHTYGYTIVLASDGAEALTLAKSHKPDIVLLDLNLPTKDGFEVLGALRDSDWGKDLPVIVLTNKDTADDVLQTLKQEVRGYFIKSDTSLDTIVEAVRGVVGA